MSIAEGLSQDWGSLLTEGMGYAPLGYAPAIPSFAVGFPTRYIIRRLTLDDYALAILSFYMYIKKWKKNKKKD